MLGAFLARIARDRGWVTADTNGPKPLEQDEFSSVVPTEAERSEAQ